MRFTKMHGAGNDYVYVNCFSEPIPNDIRGLACAVSDRHFGIGGDGLVLICPSEQGDARMRMFNADGSEAEMCGNALRCVAKYVYDHDIVKKERLKIETGAGLLTVQLDIESGRARSAQVNMGKPILDGPSIPTTFEGGGVVEKTIDVDGREFSITCVSMGNPHCVIFVEEITDELVLQWGPKIEVDPHFPAKMNVEFVKVLSPTELEMRVWERGSGETLACGSGACAVAVASVLTGRTDGEVVIHLRGGDLEIEWVESGEVFMTGPAEEVFSGDW